MNFSLSEVEMNKLTLLIWFNKSEPLKWTYITYMVQQARTA